MMCAAQFVMCEWCYFARFPAQKTQHYLFHFHFSFHKIYFQIMKHTKYFIKIRDLQLKF